VHRRENNLLARQSKLHDPKNPDRLQIEN
jgi:hypothetical protein